MRSLTVLVLQLAQAALAAVTVVLLARFLAPEAYGTYVFYVTVASILPLLVGLGGEHVFLMHGSRHRHLIGALFGTAVAIRVVLSVAALLGLALVLGLLRLAEPMPLLLITAGALLTSFSNPLILSLHRVQGSYVRPFVLAFSAPLFFIAYLGVGTASGLTLTSAAVGFCLSHLLAFLLFALDLRGRVALKPSWRLARRHARDGMVFSASQMFDYAFARLDLLLIQFALGSAALGVYAAGQRIVSLSVIIPSSFHIVELPEFHRAAGTPALTARFRNLRVLLLDVAALCFGLVILNAPFLVGLLFPPEYAGAVPVVVLLSVAMAAYFLNYPYYMLAEALNRLTPRLVAKVATFLLTIVCVLLFMWVWGIRGAAAGLLAGNAAFVGLLHYLTRDQNGGLAALIADGRAIALAIVAVAAGWGAAGLVPGALGGAVLGSAVFLAVVTGVGALLGLNQSAHRLLTVLRARLGNTSPLR